MLDEKFYQKYKFLCGYTAEFLGRVIDHLDKAGLLDRVLWRQHGVVAFRALQSQYEQDYRKSLRRAIINKRSYLRRKGTPEHKLPKLPVRLVQPKVLNRGLPEAQWRLRTRPQSYSRKIQLDGRRTYVPQGVEGNQKSQKSLKTNPVVTQVCNETVTQNQLETAVMLLEKGIEDDEVLLHDRFLDELLARGIHEGTNTPGNPVHQYAAMLFENPSKEHEIMVSDELATHKDQPRKPRPDVSRPKFRQEGPPIIPDEHSPAEGGTSLLEVQEVHGDATKADSVQTDIVSTPVFPSMPEGIGGDRNSLLARASTLSLEDPLLQNLTLHEIRTLGITVSLIDARTDDGSLVSAAFPPISSGIDPSKKSGCPAGKGLMSKANKTMGSCIQEVKGGDIGAIEEEVINRGIVRGEEEGEGEKGEKEATIRRRSEPVTKRNKLNNMPSIPEWVEIGKVYERTIGDAVRVIAKFPSEGMLQIEFSDAEGQVQETKISPNWLLRPGTEPPKSSKREEAFEELWTHYRKAVAEMGSSPGAKQTAKKYFLHSRQHQVKASEIAKFRMAMIDYLHEKQCMKATSRNFCDAAHFSTFISKWWREQIEKMEHENVELVPYGGQRARHYKNVPPESVKQLAEQYPPDYAIPIPYHEDKDVRALEISLETRHPGAQKLWWRLVQAKRNSGTLPKYLTKFDHWQESGDAVPQRLWRNGTGEKQFEEVESLSLEDAMSMYPLRELRVAQLRKWYLKHHGHSPNSNIEAGKAYYEKRLAEGKTTKQALITGDPNAN